MDVLEMEALLKSVDQRLQRVEQILPTLATQADLRELATSAWVQQMAEDTRRHFDIVSEKLRDDIRLIAESQTHLIQRVDDYRAELKLNVASLDRRLMGVEAAVKLGKSRRGPR